MNSGAIDIESVKNTRMDPLRVCYVSHYPHMRMGGQQSMLALIRNLDRSRVTPLAIVPGPGELSDTLRDLDCPVFHVPLGPIKPKHAFTIWKSIRMVKEILQREAVDIVHPDAERDAFVCGRAIRKLATRMVWHVRLTRKHHLDKRNAAMADAIIGISEGVNQRFRDQPGVGSKCRTIYNGVDLDTFCPVKERNELRERLGIPLDKFVVVFVGQLKRGKGIFELVDGVAQLTKVDSAADRFSCLMIGSAPDDNIKQELIDKIESMKLHEQLKLVPQQQNIHQWMQAANALILPSYEGVEGMGRVLFEAMACGAVAIGTDISGIRDAIADGSGLLIEPESATAISTAIARLMADDALFARLSTGGLERARTIFGIKTHARKVQDLYDELMFHK